jgi:hypothetical protein
VQPTKFANRLCSFSSTIRALPKYARAHRANKSRRSSALPVCSKAPLLYKQRSASSSTSTQREAEYKRDASKKLVMRSHERLKTHSNRSAITSIVLAFGCVPCVMSTALWMFAVAQANRKAQFFLRVCCQCSTPSSD